MEWSNEYWIRTYVKDSPSFAKCSWQAKGLFFLITRRVNSSGVLILEKGYPETSMKFISYALDRAPWNEIRPFLLELLTSGAVRIASDWSVLIVPNFVDAQNAKWEPPKKKQSRKKGAEEVVQTTTDPSVLERMEAYLGENTSMVDEQPGLSGASMAGKVTGKVTNTVTEQAHVGKVTCNLASKVTNTVNEHPSESARLHVTFSAQDPNQDLAGQGYSNGTFVTLPAEVPNQDPARQGYSNGTFVTLPAEVPNQHPARQGNNVTLPPHGQDQDLARQGNNVRHVSLPKKSTNRSEQTNRSEGEIYIAELPILDPIRPGAEPEPRKTDGAYVGEQQCLPLLGEPEELQNPKEVKMRMLVGAAWDHYLERWREHQEMSRGRTHGPKPVLNDKRAKQMADRIREVGLDVVIKAIDRLWDNPWRVKSGYTVIDYAIRSIGQLEKVLSQDFDYVNGQQRKAAANGRHGVKQAGPAADYVGKGTQYHTEKGKIVDQHGNAVELEDDPLGIGVTFS